MNILAVDTTGEAFSAALRVGVDVFAVHRVFAKPHDETLLPEIDKLLAKAGLKLQKLDGIAAASGPGRFTGIRIGMAYAAVAARCIGKPALAVTRFQALAHGRLEPLFAVVIPGFRGEKYYQVFRKGKPEGEPVWAREVPDLKMPLIEGDPAARELLGPAARLLGLRRPPKYEPLYLKPAGYERKASAPR